MWSRANLVGALAFLAHKYLGSTFGTISQTSIRYRESALSSGSAGNTSSSSGQKGGGSYYRLA
jgi:hypothetical protein